MQSAYNHTQQPRPQLTQINYSKVQIEKEIKIINISLEANIVGVLSSL